LRESVEVHTWLLDQGIEHEIYRSDHPGRTLAETSAALGLDPSEVVSVTVFETRRGPVITLATLSDEAEATAVASAVGSFSALRATPGAASRATGYVAQWIPPVAHRKQLPAYADPKVLASEIVYTSGGAPGVLLKLRSEDLIRITGATIAPLGWPLVAAVPTRDPETQPDLA
jgi:Cys-tRNA(Pro)/Cys-tRNA(Cys) deacylase